MKLQIVKNYEKLKDDYFKLLRYSRELEIERNQLKRELRKLKKVRSD